MEYGISQIVNNKYEHSYTAQVTKQITQYNVYRPSPMHAYDVYMLT